MSHPPSGDWRPPSGGWQQPPPAWQPPAGQPPAGPAPLDRPQYDATIGQAFSRFWRKYAVLSGRASRSEYWWWTLVAVVVSAVLQLIGGVIVGARVALATEPRFDLGTFLLPLVPDLVWTVVTLVPSITLGVRRLHDINRSGWWYTLVLPAYVGIGLLIAGLGSLDPERLAAGDPSGIAVGPLVAGSILTVLGSVASIVLIVFFVLPPDPRGARFDRR